MNGSQPMMGRRPCGLVSNLQVLGESRREGVATMQKRKLGRNLEVSAIGIETAASKIDVHGARLPEAILALSGR